MPTESSNDDGNGLPPLRTDAHGRAALLLVESLIHGLIAREVLTVAEAVDVVDTAAEVATDEDGATIDRRSPATLLAAVGDSLRGDLPQP